MNIPMPQVEVRRRCRDPHHFFNIIVDGGCHTCMRVFALGSPMDVKKNAHRLLAIKVKVEGESVEVPVAINGKPVCL